MGENRRPTSFFPQHSSYRHITLIAHPFAHRSSIENNYVDYIPQQSRRNVSVMRKSAFEDRMRRLIRKDIQYELDQSPRTKNWILVYILISEYFVQLLPNFKSFPVDERPGE